MNARTAAFVVSRLLGLFVLGNYGSVALAEVIATIFDQNWPHLTFHIVTLALYVVIAVLLWLGAGTIADCAAKSLPENSSETVDPRQGMFLAVSLTGGMFVLASAQALNRVIMSYERHDEILSQGILSILIAGGLPLLIIGLVLMIGSRAIVNGLNSLRAWGNKPFISEGE